jgi:calcium-translocating P-type ATPase
MPFEAERRVREYGANRIEEIGREPMVRRLLRQFTHFFALLLWAGAALAFFGEWHAPGEGMATLGYAILGVILVNGLFSFWQEYRAERALAALRDLLPPQAKVLRDHRVYRLIAEELVPGDIVLLEQGDKIPADCRLIEDFGGRVNNATLTGESAPEPRDAQPTDEDDLLRSGNIVLAGASLAAGEAKALVFATGMHTEFGKIAHLTQTEGEALSPLQREISRLSRLIAVLSVALGLLFFIIGQVIGLPFWNNFVFAIGIIVANVPEGLLPTVTLALAMAAERMARRNALIRHLPSAETLGSATVICTDKTGTLTQNRMAVKQVFLGEAVLDIADIALEPTRVERNRPFFLAARLCHTLTQAGNGDLLGDPMEIALVEMAEKAVPKAPSYTRVDELPFDSRRLRVSTVYETPGGRMLYCKGAAETVLPLCKTIAINGVAQPFTAELREQTARAQDAMADQGLRVLAFAYRQLAPGMERRDIERDLVFAGLTGLEDPPRPEVPEAIRRCREAGIKVIMVTGDHPHTALAIAREIGLVETNHPRVVTGDRLRKLTHTQLQLALDTPEILFARVSPEEKLRIVNILKRKGHIVAVTGDGVNDAPALKAAHIGIAMGVTGTDVAKEAADMVLLDDNFASIVNAIEEGRTVFENIRKFMTYILTSNVPELIPYLAFALFKIPLALTIIQILAVDLGTDLVPALGLGAERPDKAVMEKPPRTRGDRLINIPLLVRSYLFLGIMEAGAAMAAFFFVLQSGGWSYGQSLPSDSPLYLQATTACLSAIIVTQVVNVFLCRSPRDSILKTGLGRNWLILWGLVIEIGLILAIDYTPWGNALFGTAPISGHVWLFAMAMALVMLMLEEARKWLARQA